MCENTRCKYKQPCDKRSSQNKRGSDNEKGGSLPEPAPQHSLPFLVPALGNIASHTLTKLRLACALARTTWTRDETDTDFLVGVSCTDYLLAFCFPPRLCRPQADFLENYKSDPRRFPRCLGLELRRHRYSCAAFQAIRVE